MDTFQREKEFETKLGEAWPSGFTKYRKDWVRLPQSKIVSEYPLLVDLELASICNLKCPMCYTITDEFKKNVNTKTMSFDLFKRIIDEISGKTPSVRLSLRGEATVHPKFIECIKYAKDKNIQEVSSLTNGGKLKGEFMERVLKAGIDWITISVDGVGETYEKIRKPIKFDQILQNIKEIHNFKIKNSLNRPVIKIQGIWPAIKEDPDTYYNTFKPYVDLIAFNPLIDYLGKDHEISYLDSFTCPQQYQRLVIGADGLVMKCSNDEENREPIGNANLQTVHEIWHGKKMQEIREMQKKHQGFRKSPVCMKCYLPRQTIDETATVNGREFVVKNYVARSQMIGH